MVATTCNLWSHRSLPHLPSRRQLQIVRVGAVLTPSAKALHVGADHLGMQLGLVMVIDGYTYANTLQKLECHGMRAYNCGYITH